MNPRLFLRVPVLTAKPWPSSSHGNYILPPKISPACAIRTGENINVQLSVPCPRPRWGLFSEQVVFCCRSPSIHSSPANLGCSGFFSPLPAL